jgi:hypothetical protein
MHMLSAENDRLTFADGMMRLCDGDVTDVTGFSHRVEGIVHRWNGSICWNMRAQVDKVESVNDLDSAGGVYFRGFAASMDFELL